MPAWPRPAEGRRIYAVGDVHGRSDLLARLLDMIACDAAARAGDGLCPVLVMLGDYVDRGPDSRGVLDLLSGSPPIAGFRCVFLQGNHEDMMLRALRAATGEGRPQDKGVVDIWLANGGRETLRSYGLGQEDGLGALPSVLPASHRRFLHGLDVLYVSGDYLFVHAGIDPSCPVDQQDPEVLMWIREPFLSAVRCDGPMIVHGHTIRGEPEEQNRRIGIDTGAYASGRLTCLVVEPEGWRYLTT